MPVLGERAGLDRPGDAEIDHPRPVLGQQHVRRLQVAVHHARGVDRAQALGQPRGQRQHRGGGQRPVLAHRVGQRGPGARRRWPARAPGPPRPRRSTGAVNNPLTLRATRDLPPETGPELGVLGQFGPDHLDRHRPAARRQAQVYPAHAARAEPSAQPVRPDQLRIPRLELAHDDSPRPSPGRSGRPAHRCYAAGRRSVQSGVLRHELMKLARARHPVIDIVSIDR